MRDADMGKPFAAFVFSAFCLIAPQTASAQAPSAQTPPSVRVVTKMAQVLARPASGADVVMTPAQGTVLNVIDADGGWYWVSLPPNGSGTRTRGWIQARDVEAVAADLSAAEPPRPVEQGRRDSDAPVQTLRSAGVTEPVV